LGELYLSIGKIEKASEEVKKALGKNENFIRALILKGRIKIEKKRYEEAYEEAKHLFQRAIEMGPDNILPIVWKTYSQYLAIFTEKRENRVFQEEMVSIIRELERVRDRFPEGKRQDRKIKAYVLYFLGSFYYKIGDFFTAKKRLHECLKECERLKEDLPIKSSVNELLGYVWNHKIRPTFWQWWFYSPFHCAIKRIIFIASCIFLIVLLLGAFISPPSFMPSWILPLNLNTRMFIMLFILFILILPTLVRFKTAEFEIEIAPPPSEPIIFPSSIEESIKKIE